MTSLGGIVGSFILDNDTFNTFFGTKQNPMVKLFGSIKIKSMEVDLITKKFLKKGQITKMSNFVG